MSKGNQNLYQISRKRANFTQEQAAEALDVSIESIRAWEGGQRVPAADIVDLMVIAYNDPALSVRHMWAVSNAARVAIPNFEPGQPLPQAAVHLISLLGNFQLAHRHLDLMKIAANGRVDEHEEGEFLNILDEMREIETAILALRYSDKGRVSDDKTA